MEMQSLNEFMDSTMTEINRIALILNWDAERLKNVDECCVCPYDSSHRVPNTSMDKHLAPCRWKTEGYQESDLPLSQPVSTDKSSSIRFDQALQAQILENSMKMECTLPVGLAEHLIPRTSDRLLTSFTCKERRALYEYAIANTVKPDIGQDLAGSRDGKAESKNEKELSYLEVLAQERNMKRRRAKHKGVHTNKKSHTEILREVINQQMEIYIEQMADSTDDSSSFGNLEEIKHIRSGEGTQQQQLQQQQYSTQILNKPADAHRGTSVTKKCEQYHSGLVRYGERFQDQQKTVRHSLGERGEEGNVCSRRRHSHHEEKKKWSHFHHRDSTEDTHRPKHESHKEKNRKSGKGEGSYRHCSHHTRGDRRLDREKEKNRD